MDLEFRAIAEQDKILNFDCGIESLNDFLKNYAYLNQTRRLSATMIACTKGDDPIIGYYTLSPAQIDAEAFPKKLSRSLPKYPIPAIRLCRLAIDIKFQKKKCGQELLVHALNKCYQQSTDLGGYCVVVDAINEQARVFYEKFGFTSFVNQSQTLFLPMKAIHLYIAG